MLSLLDGGGVEGDKNRVRILCQVLQCRRRQDDGFAAQEGGGVRGADGHSG